MEEKKYPFVKEITFKNLIRKYGAEFSLKKAEIAKRLYLGCDRTLRRVSSGERKLAEDEYELLFSAIKADAGGRPRDFVKLMVKWYPALAAFTTEAAIRSVIKANLNGTASPDVALPAPAHPRMSSMRFLQSCLERGIAVSGVKMAYQTGWLWLEKQERTELLILLAKTGVPIQVIANPESVIKDIAYTMSDPDLILRYKGFNETLFGWHKYECAYDSIQLRISKYPIMRKTLIVSFEDGTSTALLGEYAYGSPSKEAPPYRIMNSDEESYAFYNNEFSFLWDRAKTFTEWSLSLPRKEEYMKPGYYLLVYLSHGKESNEEWIFSALSVEENNTAKLRVNISQPADAVKEDASFEYSYRGHVRLTPYNVFISLNDEARSEEVNISLSRLLHSGSRFLGIMTGVSPSGQPAAFKCACFDRASISIINFKVLRDVLGHHNQEWSDSLMITESRDINLFYSDRLFSRNPR